MSEGPTAEGIRMRKKKRFVWLRYDLEDKLEILREAMLLFRVTNTATGMQAMHEMLKEEDIIKLKIQGAGQILEILSFPPADSDVRD